MRKLYGSGADSRYVRGFYMPRAGASLAIIPPIDAASSGRASESELVLLHEYAHHYMAENAAYLVPRWYGEGFAEFSAGSADQALVAMRYVNNKGEPTEKYPCNPSGSPRGITGVTTADGRFTIVMPHPERCFRNVQMSWSPPGSGEDSPWMQLFHNARRWVG